MKKYFGRYLVERKIVTEHELVIALIDQSKTAPSIPEIVLRLQLMNPEQVLDVFDRQTSLGVDFMRAARELSLWSEEIQRKVFKVLEDEKRLIGEILISKGLVRAESLVDILDDYINEPDIHTTPEKTVLIPVVESPSVEMGLSEKVQESKKPLEDFDAVGAEVQEYFTNVRLERISGELPRLDFSGIRKVIKELRGRIYLANLKRMNSILFALEEIAGFGEKGAISISELEAYRGLVLDAISLSWDIVEEGQRKISEEEFIKRNETSSFVAHLIKRIHEIKDRKIA